MRPFAPAQSYRIGLRTVKTGLAVMLALALAARRSPDAIPIFAAIGAIAAMSRTLADAVTAAATQLAGTLLGATAGCLFVYFLPGHQYLSIGLGLILLIPLCRPLRIGFAVPLASIVFVSVCLYDPTQGEPFFYAVNRFLDSSIGLAVGFVVNALIKPYNNRRQIDRLFTQLLTGLPPMLDELLTHGHYPDRAALERQLDRLSDEIQLFADQPLPDPARRRSEAVFLRGCFQLAQKIGTELTALAGMDTLGQPDAEQSARLRAIGLSVRDPETPPVDRDSVVLNYHLRNLLDARDFLIELLAQPPGGR